MYLNYGCFTTAKFWTYVDLGKLCNLKPLLRSRILPTKKLVLWKRPFDGREWQIGQTLRLIFVMIHTNYWNFYTFRPVQTERVKRSRIGQFNAHVKCGQLENALSYCILCSKLHRSERAFKLNITIYLLWYQKRLKRSREWPKLEWLKFHHLYLTHLHTQNYLQYLVEFRRYICRPSSSICNYLICLSNLINQVDYLGRRYSTIFVEKIIEIFYKIIFLIT